MDLISHLGELRARVLFCLFFLILGFSFSWIFSNELLSIITEPVKPYLEHNNRQLIFIAPMDEFLSHLKVATYGAIILSFPFIFYQIWKFLAPGLYKDEKGLLILWTFFGSLLFFLGIIFIYFVIYPLSFSFLFNFGTALPMISLKDYLSFFIQTSFIFGILFETPLIITSLTWMDILSVNQLRKGRRYAIVIMAVLAAIVTPPDVFSMLFLLVPFYLLYEISILISWWLVRGKKS